jgi:Mlc titration factor MtfA (ptsG expression regulator)
MGFFTEGRRRKEILRAPFPDAWRTILTNNVVHWRYLDGNEHGQAEETVKAIVALKTWSPAQGFDMTDEVRVTIAGQAALLVLGFPGYEYPNVRTIVVHATTIRLPGQRYSVVEGTQSNADLALFGQSDEDGTVYLVWDELLANARHPERGHNLVYHEFAHTLDRANGTVDGIPPMEPEARDRWTEVCNREYDRLQHGVDDPLLRSYAGVNQAEFFAVVTEVFFDQPVAMREQKPDLYDVLRDFYGQDPASRVIPPS